VRDLSVAGWSIYVEFERWRVKCPKCVSVHVEHLDWLAENPRYRQRKEEDLDEFFNLIGKSKCKRIDLAVKRWLTGTEMESFHIATQTTKSAWVWLKESTTKSE
jgi:hypothetical protein